MRSWSQTALIMRPRSSSAITPTAGIPGVRRLHVELEISTQHSTAVVPHTRWHASARLQRQCSNWVISHDLIVQSYKYVVVYLVF